MLITNTDIEHCDKAHRRHATTCHDCPLHWDDFKKHHPYRKACEAVNNLVRNNVPIPFEHTLYDQK